MLFNFFNGVFVIIFDWTTIRFDLYIGVRDKRDWLVGCKVKANCPLVGPGTVGRVPSMGVFLRDPSTYLREFRRKNGKLRTARSTSTIGDWTLHLPSTSLEHRNASLLIGRDKREKKVFIFKPSENICWIKMKKFVMNLI